MRRSPPAKLIAARSARANPGHGRVFCKQKPIAPHVAFKWRASHLRHLVPTRCGCADPSTNAGVALGRRRVLQRHRCAPLTFSVVAGAASGTVSAVAADGSFTYTPAAGFSGTDSFGIAASDGTGTSATATFTVTVNRVPAGPPTSKDQCKNGGWKTFDNPTFKNQGECVSYVQTH